MRRLFIVPVFALALAGPAFAQEIDGDWKGKLDTPIGELSVIFHIKKTPAGYDVTGDSPDQGALGLVGELQSSSPLKMYFPQAMGTYEGKWDAARGAFVGNWSQNGESRPLIVARDTPKS